MKPVRIKDFDPHVTVPELNSPLDDYPRIEPPQAEGGAVFPGPPAPAPMQRTQPAVRTDERAPARTPVVPYARTEVRRSISRYAFEFFQDQIDTLRKFSLEEKTRGEKGSMSEMVREALDRYISKRMNTD